MMSIHPRDIATDVVKERLAPILETLWAQNALNDRLHEDLAKLEKQVESMWSIQKKQTELNLLVNQSLERFENLLHHLTRLEKRAKELEGAIPDTVVFHHLKHEIETPFPQDPRDSDKCRLCGCSWSSWDMMIVCKKAREEEQ
jgi:predicted nuclease with TOPRIM domain